MSAPGILRLTLLPRTTTPITDSETTRVGIFMKGMLLYEIDHLLHRPGRHGHHPEHATELPEGYLDPYTREEPDDDRAGEEI